MRSATFIKLKYEWKMHKYLHWKDTNMALNCQLAMFGYLCMEASSLWCIRWTRRELKSARTDKRLLQPLTSNECMYLLTSVGTSLYLTVSLAGGERQRNCKEPLKNLWSTAFVLLRIQSVGISSYYFAFDFLSPFEYLKRWQRQLATWMRWYFTRSGFICPAAF